VEQKLFVSETALAPPSAAVAAIQEGKDSATEDASDVDVVPVSKKGLAHPAHLGVGTVGKKVMTCSSHFLIDVANNNLSQYDVSSPALPP
jgi:eukaryotic translation initiation factor 2C